MKNNNIKLYPSPFRPALMPRIVRQLGLGLTQMGAGLSSGIGPVTKGELPRQMVWPNKLAKGARMEVNIAGRSLEI